MFTFVHGTDQAFLLWYIDDIVLTASSPTLLQRIIVRLTREFAVKDLVALHFFLGIRVTHTPARFFLSQQQYAEDVLERAGMDNCSSAPAPADTKGKLPSADGPRVADASIAASSAPFTT
jgi:hypothetical protein